MQMSIPKLSTGSTTTTKVALSQKFLYEDADGKLTDEGKAMVCALLYLLVLPNELNF
jgi:hypothetical protein